MVITPESSKSFHTSESQYDGWSSRMPTIVSIYSQHAGCVLRLLNCTDCDVWLYQKNLCLFKFEMHLISGINNEPPPLAKLNVKTGPLCSLYFGIYYSFGFSRVDGCFLRFLECFPAISGFCIAVQYRVYYCFSIIFWVLASGHPSPKFHYGSNL